MILKKGKNPVEIEKESWQKWRINTFLSVRQNQNLRLVYIRSCSESNFALFAFATLGGSYVQS